MSRKLTGIPKNTVQRIEFDTTALLKLLSQHTYKEQRYEKPFRVFTRGFDTVKFCMQDGVAFFNDNKFSGITYGDIVGHIEKQHLN